MKTDKELAVELTCAFVQSWNSNPENESITPEATIELLQKFKNAIIQLDKD